MNHKRPPLPAIIVVALLVILSAYFILAQAFSDKNGALTASGVIEAVQVNIAPEIAGKAAEVLVEEGQSVSMDDPLLQLDPSLLAAQRVAAVAGVDSAQSALASAQTKYDQALQAALSAQQASHANDWRFSAPDEFNQPAWYFDQSEQLAAAQAEVDAARVALVEAHDHLEKVIGDLDNADFIEADRRLAEARAAFEVADEVKFAADNAGEGEGGGLQNAAYENYDLALVELRAAQSEYNAFLNSRSRQDILMARGKVAAAQQRYDAAHTHWASLQTGVESPAVTSAKKALDQAVSAVAQAQANLALIDVQVAKLTVIAPMGGVILTRNVEVGEFLQPGATTFVLGQLNDLTITVYVPENRYGEISLGQQAEVTADSFPDATFTAEVIQIADKAEFTPRNVQTVEGRSSTVFAIKLKVNDPDGRLKIGMPADVAFQ
jgi:HlyD family secretion protein